MDWARFSAEYETLTVLSVADRDEALADMAQKDRRLSDLLRSQLEREDTGGFMATSAPSPSSKYPELLENGVRIGAWRIESVLGKGGMGAVYRVTRDDGTFEQTAALKTLRRTGEAHSTRFEKERRRLAMLEHPNIARIIDGGADDVGQPFMVVELVEGEPIDKWASGKSQDEKLRLLRQLCRALAHAHARLVLHRDIKPGNVLVNEAGEVRLIDFGIAELADDDALSGPGPLTFAVAAPEQLEGGQITTATDIFQVGMVAHRLLAGTWPARQPTGGVSIDASKVRDSDLRAILTKATARDPAQRYDSVDALGDDLTNFSHGSPVMARGGGALYRVRKFVGRYKVASGLAAVALLALILGLGASLYSYNLARTARAKLETQLAIANYKQETANFYGEVGDTGRDLYQFAARSDPEASQKVDELRLERFENYLSNIDQAYTISSGGLYAIIRDAIDQRNYPLVVELGERALNEEKLSEPARMAILNSLAQSYYLTGNTKKSIAVLKKIQAWFEARSYLKAERAHADNLVRLVIYGKEMQFVPAARRWIKYHIKTTVDTEDRAYLYNELANLEQVAGNFENMIEAQIAGFELAQRSDLQDQETKQISRALNLAYTISYGRPEIELIDRYLPSKKRIDQNFTINKSNEMLYFWVQSEKALIQNKPDEALRHAKRGFESIMRESPDNAYYQSIIACQVTRAALTARDRETASAFLEKCENGAQRIGENAIVRSRLAKSHYLALTGDRNAARKLLNQILTENVAYRQSVEFDAKVAELQKMLGE